MGPVELTYPLSAGELAAGVKTLTGVPNARYEVRLMNTTFVKGTINLMMEGDVLLAPGATLMQPLTPCLQAGS